MDKNVVDKNVEATAAATLPSAISQHDTPTTGQIVVGCLFLLLGLIVVFGPLVLGGLDVVHGSRGDPRLVNYTLEHGFRWVTREPPHLSFWDPPIFFPYRNVSAFTDLLIGSGPLYWIWRLAGCAPDTAFSLWMLLIWSANYLLALVMLRRCFRFSATSASIGAYLFAFGNPRLVDFGHQQLMPQLYVLVVVIAAFALLESRGMGRYRSWCWIAVLAAAVVLQLYTAFYPFFFFGLMLAGALLIALISGRTRAPLLELVRSRALPLAVTAVLSAAAAWPAVSHYLAAAGSFPSWRLGQRWIPTPSSWLLMGSRNLLWGHLQWEGGAFEDQANPNQSNGIGPVTTLLCLAGLYRVRSRRSVQLIILAAGILVAAATNFGGFWAWHLVKACVPGAAAIRAVGRIGMVVMLPAAIGVAACMEGLIRNRWPRLSGRWKYLVVVVLTVTCCAEQVSRTSWIAKEHERQHLQSIVDRIDPSCEAFLLVCTGPERCERVDDDAMWAQLASSVPTINGRYGHAPPLYRLRKKVIVTSDDDRTALRQELRKWVERNGMSLDSICWVEYPGYSPSGNNNTRWPPLPLLGR